MQNAAQKLGARAARRAPIALRTALNVPDLA
jgi:hypothetical protein